MGVEPDAMDSDLRAAFKTLARRYHPDLSASLSEPDRVDSDDQMRQINAAWHVLSDPQRRADYDRSLGLGEATNFVRRPDDVAFVPYLYDDDADDDTDDDDDWRYESDVGDPRTTPHRGILMVPIVLALLSAGVGFAWMVSDIQMLLTAAVVVGALSLVSFIATPILAMAKAAQYETSEHRPGRP